MKKQEILNRVWERLDQMWADEWLNNNDLFVLNAIKHTIDDVLELESSGYHEGTYNPGV